MTKPNVLLLMTDQQRWDTLGCYGNGVIETPNLDYLAANGTVFESGYTCTPSCVPARMVLLTGQDIWNLGFFWMGDGMGGAPSYLENSLPEMLANAGYHTQCVGKLNVTPQRSLQGFHHTVLDEASQVKDPHFESDYVKWFNKNRPAEVGREDHGIDWNSWMSRPWHLPEYLHPTAWTAQESIRFLERRDPTKPFFLKTSFHRPHSPYDAPPYYFDLYNQKEIPEAQVGEWAAIHDNPKDAADPNAWHGKRKPEEIRRARMGYYGNISFIDHQIGCILGALRKSKDFDNTIIVFTSDHGDMLGDNNLWRKGYAYEGSAHIPFIVYLPAAMREQVQARSVAPVCLQDMMPTILDACGIEIPGTVDGKSVLPLMRGEQTNWRDFVHGEHDCVSPDYDMQYLTDGHWKYIWFPRINQEQLFDLSKDRYETRNLAGDGQYQDELLKWRGRLIGTLEPRNDGLVKNGELVCQGDAPRIVSSKYKERLERAGLKWKVDG